MGGDNAAEAIVIGCLNAIKTEEGFDITLFGDSKIIADILCNYNYDKSRIKVEHCSEVILFKDTPTVAVKNKKDSSLVRALTAMREGNGDAVISAGNTGALLTGSLLITGRMQKVIRPALGALIPSGEKFALLIDAD